jgi:hypothetical protein
VASDGARRGRRTADRCDREIRDVRCGDCEQPRCVCVDEFVDDTAWIPILADHDAPQGECVVNPLYQNCANCGQPRIPRRCLKCNALVDGHTAVDLSAACPEPGDVSVCLYCCNIAFFTETGLRDPDAAEREKLLADDQLTKAVLAVREMHEAGYMRGRAG